MTSFVVLGDAGVGKTAFMYRAIHGAVPLNIFTLTKIRRFCWRGALQSSSASFAVVPGAATDSEIGHALDGADGVIVMYRDDLQTARRWLCRAARAVHNMQSVPLMVVCIGAQSQGRLAPLLRAFPSAEHAAVTSVTGAQDCINRIVHRARRSPPSPLEMRTGRATALLPGTAEA